MTITPDITLADGSLVTHGGVLLANVPDNVTLTVDSQSGVFLGVQALEKSCRHVFTLGVLERLRFLCCFRFKLWWMTQRTGTCGSDVPLETQFLLLESKSSDEAIYTVFLPMVEGAFRSSLQGSAENELEICLESGDPAVVSLQGLHTLYIHSGSNPFQVLNDAMRAVKSHLQTFSLRTEKKLPGMLDWFGWCTWDAFYTDVSAAGVRNGLESLCAGGTPPRFLIIDDGWQSVAHDDPPGSVQQAETQVITSGVQFAKRLTDIKENHKFQRNGESGLHHIVAEAKSEYNLKYIYVWHAVLGYWGGLQPGLYQAKLAYPSISPGLLQHQPDMAHDSLTLHGLGLVDPNHAFAFYNELHSYLASSGIDGVKVDVQSILETLGEGHGGRVQLTKKFYQALEASIARNFPDNGCIACMSHNTDGFYSSNKTAVVRASDDFWPADPASHTIHIASVAYNSLFLGEVMQPDWDMFQSLHPAAEYHAAARAVGGCGVYVSDKPGHHDFNLLKKLVLPDGSVLRAQLPGRPTRDCLFSDPTQDEKSILKIWNVNKHTGVIGAFNCQGAGWCKVSKTYRIHDDSPMTVTGSIRACDVEFLDTVVAADWNGDAVVYSHRAGELVLLPKGTAIPVSLEHLKYEIFTIVPVKCISEDLVFAPIGLVNMFNSGGAITSLDYAVAEATNDGSGNAVLKITVRGCGVFGAYSSRRPKSVTLESSGNLDFFYDSNTGFVKIDLGERGGELSIAM
ncbi:LOW QUALITY PROTEIN: probable galactinol--sucrose galactosyltransferase 2 [Selaginella moellendorffii]|uniref:LOW QUALITY PROTEIN: probable galactinol--sucrose galactosyltransferase 2 n=1 Tax=Selaginella moellendorffii TaxID=88036 RepID=UPI000D1CCB37|nr:LOW QUALITY PROTEIN: probable galactinol--sucrose galactosyltransferase 2 [Selaginella moellendorffii]|eukprot:XP_024525695.1 LOW QUALITY PROTEIN: probable galactinol--sucrose galactosyltransferase 2 [Selaginella moellendorffii]